MVIDIAVMVHIRFVQSAGASLPPVAGAIAVAFGLIVTEQHPKRKGHSIGVHLCRWVRVAYWRLLIWRGVRREVGVKLWVSCFQSAMRMQSAWLPFWVVTDGSGLRSGIDWNLLLAWVGVVRMRVRIGVEIGRIVVLLHEYWSVVDVLVVELLKVGNAVVAWFTLSAVRIAWIELTRWCWLHLLGQLTQLDNVLLVRSHRCWSIRIQQLLPGSCTLEWLEELFRCWFVHWRFCLIRFNPGITWEPERCTVVGNCFRYAFYVLRFDWCCLEILCPGRVTVDIVLLVAQVQAASTPMFVIAVIAVRRVRS